MKYDLKKITSRAFLIYGAINVFTYLFAHVAYLFANDVIGELFEYVSYYLSKTVEFIAPPIIAAVALTVLIGYGKGALVKFTLTVASARLFYSLPYYYIICIYSLVLNKQCKKCGAVKEEALTALITKSTVTDFLCAVNIPILTFALTRFAFSFVMELIDTITFFVEYRSDYLPKEIITILVNFTLLFVLLVVSYLIAANVKNALIDEPESEQDTEN